MLPGQPPQTPPASPRHALPVLLLVLVWLTFLSWMRPFAMPDEGRYVGVAWSMVQSGDWLVPRLDGLPFFHKPPLFYWLSAAGMSVFGLNEWAARLAPLAGAWAGCAALYLFMRRWSGSHRANVALLVLATQPLFYGAAQYANLDMLVAGCIAVTILCGAHAVLLQKAGLPNRWAVLTMWAFAGLGLLAKGLIGAALPALVLLVWLVPARAWRGIATLLWWPGPIVFLAVAAPWFVLMQLHYPEFFDYFFVEQHWNRFTATGFNNPQPWWFYPAVLLVGVLPWSGWLPRAVRSWWGAGVGLGSIRLLMWSWLVVVVAFFSMPTSKLVGYVLPVLPALAWLTADAVGTAPVSGRRWFLASAVFAGVLCATLAVAAVWLQPRSSALVGRAIAAERAAGEPVIYVDGNFYDVPLYAGLESPAIIVGRWTEPAFVRPDGWARELGDAARFEPARAEGVLIEPSALVPTICAAPRVWLVGAPVSSNSYPFLDQATKVVSTSHAVLWRLDTVSGPLADVLRCAPLPNQPAAAKSAAS